MPFVVHFIIKTTIHRFKKTDNERNENEQHLLVNVLNRVLVSNEELLLHVICMAFCSLVENTCMVASFQVCGHTSRLISPGK